MRHRELLEARPDWRRTGHPRFPVAAQVGREWWVLRVNCFPDHARWTLLIDGGARCVDVDEAPPAWGRPADPSLPALTPEEAAAALAPVSSFVAYGSEAGQPCDDPFCCG